MDNFFKYTTEMCLLVIVVAIIAMNFCWIETTEPLKTISNLVVWAFFGAKIPWLINK